jgi:hypothetical protein
VNWGFKFPYYGAAGQILNFGKVSSGGGGGGSSSSSNSSSSSSSHRWYTIQGQLDCAYTMMYN